MDKKSIGVCLSKLKREHLELTPFSKMRVDLAAQVIHINYSNVICECDDFIGVE